MERKLHQFGMIGLGVMGRNLVLNIAEHGFSVIGYDKDKAMVARLNQEAGGKQIRGVDSLEEFLAFLKEPRNIMMLVPAGAPVDNVIRDLLPHLKKGDMIIDGGNSHYKDTDLRARSLAEKGILYLGVGISGGEKGARSGPSMMPGGTPEAYERVAEIFQAVAAKIGSEPCVTYLGPGSAGHYVKMVHNGIEYGIMQLIAETYDLMKRGLGLNDEEIHEVFSLWNQAELEAYLVEISGAIFEELDEKTGARLIDVILDEAKQKGTGMWTSQDAMDLQVPVPTIDIAVAMRNLSAKKSERQKANRLLGENITQYSGERSGFVDHLRGALYAGFILVYAQGFNQLHVASGFYNYGLGLQGIAAIWRGGCIIRSALLEEIRSTFKKTPGLSSLLLDPDLGKEVLKRRKDLETIIKSAVEMKIPVPGFSVSLAYLDGFRSVWLPANLIQAQRDYFGSHTYERIDEKGVFHTRWS
ncbi:MAG: NADP-dependent phosphogluconate dehydrogenase [Anaerolineales bacterium]